VQQHSRCLHHIIAYTPDTDNNPVCTLHSNSGYEVTFVLHLKTPDSTVCVCVYVSDWDASPSRRRDTSPWR